MSPLDWGDAMRETALSDADVEYLRSKFPGGLDQARTVIAFQDVVPVEDVILAKVFMGHTLIAEESELGEPSTVVGSRWGLMGWCLAAIGVWVVAGWVLDWVGVL